MKLIEKTPEERAKEIEELKLESEVMSARAELEERKAIVRQLRKEYGHDWKRILGVSKLTDLATLRSFLKKAKVGMEKAALVPPGHPMNRMRDLTIGIPRGVRKA